MRILVTLLIGAMLFPAICIGAYKSEELCFIPWGDGPDSFPAYPPDTVEADAPADTTLEPGTGYLMPVGGPHHNFIDDLENIYITADLWTLEVPPDNYQLRIYDKNGKETARIEKDKFIIDTIAIQMNRGIFVDSRQNIFFYFANTFGSAQYDGLYEVNHLGENLHEIRIPINNMKFIGFYPNSNEVLTLIGKDKTRYTLHNDSIFEGYGSGWLARDGFYYNIKLLDSITVECMRYKRSDLKDNATSTPLRYLRFDRPKRGVKLLGLDDNMNIYVRSWEGDSLIARYLSVDVFDSTCAHIDSFELFLIKSNKYAYVIANPICFHIAGIVYEFRLLDDGLHVIKWAKE